MEEKNTNFAYIAIVAIVAVVALIVLVIGGIGTNQKFATTNNAATDASGQATRIVPTPIVKANSCDADDTCEISNALIAKTAIFKGDIYTNGKLQANTFTLGYVNGEMSAIDTIGFGEETQFRSNVDAIFKGDADVNGKLTIGSLAGTGNAYACLDSTGTLYRSQTPCI